MSTCKLFLLALPFISSSTHAVKYHLIKLCRETNLHLLMLTANCLAGLQTLARAQCLSVWITCLPVSEAWTIPVWCSRFIQGHIFIDKGVEATTWTCACDYYFYFFLLIKVIVSFMYVVSIVHKNRTHTSYSTFKTKDDIHVLFPELLWHSGILLLVLIKYLIEFMNWAVINCIYGHNYGKNLKQCTTRTFKTGAHVHQFELMVLLRFTLIRGSCCYSPRTVDGTCRVAR